MAIRLALRLSMGALTGAAGAALVLWPARLQTARDGTAYLPWASGSWKQLVFNADGQVSRNRHDPFILAAIAALVLVTLISLGLAAAPAPASPADICAQATVTVDYPAGKYRS